MFYLSEVKISLLILQIKIISSITKKKISLDSYIKKLVYKDDDSNIDFDKETGAVNIVKEKINERRRMESGKSKVAIKIENETKMKNEKERKKGDKDWKTSPFKYKI